MAQTVIAQEGIGALVVNLFEELKNRSTAENVDRNTSYALRVAEKLSEMTPQINDKEQLRAALTQLHERMMVKPYVIALAAAPSLQLGAKGFVNEGTCWRYSLNPPNNMTYICDVSPDGTVKIR